MTFSMTFRYDENGEPIEPTDLVNDVEFHNEERVYNPDAEEVLPDNEYVRIVSNEFRNIRNYMQRML